MRMQWLKTSSVFRKCIHLHRPKTINEAGFLIENSIRYYNHGRIQPKTKLTPLEKRRQLA